MKIETFEIVPRSRGCICSSLRAVLADRERELLEIKGPCRNPGCRLHYAHSGPCHEENV
jgi:hypothetical protein